MFTYPPVKFVIKDEIIYDGPDITIVTPEAFVFDPSKKENFETALRFIVRGRLLMKFRLTRFTRTLILLMRYARRKVSLIVLATLPVRKEIIEMRKIELIKGISLKF